ncbi:sigma-54-dependent transcriptional regulator [Desulfurivibrio sp. D14AmB]|uniref:sigma-54-dependent transcriptional regulator n=1 Tax=Desulfurivibrio sp. D14AmB TaxID=3374370 RepID=UPI00376F2603
MNGKVLIIDDEIPIRKAFTALLEERGLTTTAVESGSEALALLAAAGADFDIVLLDFAMPEMDGLAVLREIHHRHPEIVVIMITGYTEVALVVEAIKLGAYDYLLKPPDPDHLLLTIERALEKGRLQREVRQLDRSLDSSLEMQLGRSEAIRRVIEEIRQVAASDFSLIIEGETGTGKTFIASLIHNLSHRAAGPFIALDMGSIPESLLESELFGHEKGAFTGAERRKKGYFELARGGTLLLDELQNLSLQAQGKILQVVEEKSYYPVGGSRPLTTDLRIIGATNSDLSRAVAERTFRQDLYYRLNEYHITLPPLRQRPEDIPLLAARLLTDAATEMNRGFTGLDESALALLAEHPWPGNVRELKNVLRRAALQSDNLELNAEMIAWALANGRKDSATAPERPSGQAASAPISLEAAEREAIDRALAHTGGNRTKTAAILGITHKTLLTKIRKYGLS